MPENENGLVDIKRFLETPERPISNAEFSEFWKSLTEEEKDEFRKAELK